MKTETRVHTTRSGSHIIKVVDETGTKFYIEGYPGELFNTMQEAIDTAEAREEDEENEEEAQAL